MTQHEFWGPLAEVARVAGVTDIVVNAPDEVWVDRGRGLEPAGVRFHDAAHVRQVAVRLAGLGGRRLDDAQPVVDARLPDGSRLHAVLPPVAAGCTAISIRTVRQGALTMEDLVHSGMITPALRPVLEALVRERLNVVISGATGAGKTTVLASLLSLVPATERIVVIEEAGEVMPTHPHVVRLVERRANVEGAGEVTLSHLVKEALRMRPDRVILGECRGAEVREVMAAFNTGHHGGMLTVHANSAQDVPSRFHAMGSLAGMSARAVELFATAAFDVVVHVERTATTRRVSQVGLLTRRGELSVVPALAVSPEGALEHGAGWASLQDRLGVPSAVAPASAWAA